MNLRICAGVFAGAAALAACAGVRSTPSPPTPPSAAPSDLPPIPTPRSARPSAIIPGAISIDSNPQGLQVTINGSDRGLTPLTTPAPFSLSASTIVVHGPAADYDIAYQASGTLPADIYYNSQADDAGVLQSISTTAIAGRAGEPLRSNTSGRPIERSGWSASQLYVTYAPRHVRAPLPGRDLFALPEERELRLVTVDPAQIETVRADLRGRAGVLAVDRVALIHLLSATAPNDPFFPFQWDLTVIHAPQAWAITKGNPSIDVAVVDTGFDARHPDIAGKVDYAESDIFGVTTPGFDAAQDLIGHGTNVSGIIAAMTDNGIGYAGTAYNVRLQEYNVFNGDAASGADVALAVSHAAAHAARVINLSIGAGVFIDAGMYAAIQAAIARGVIVVAAAGNQGLSIMEEPAADPGVIAVGASAIDDRGTGDLSGASEYVASYSNYGPLMTLLAPGGDPAGSSDTDYLHRVNNLWTSTENGEICTITPADGCGYRGSAGTSMAAPHVTAAVALMLSVDPQLTPGKAAQILRTSADDIGDSKQGAGRLNVDRAVSAAAGLPQPSRPQKINFVAIAYTAIPGTSVPNILDVTYPRGVPVSSDGSFRVADVRANAGPFEIGLWYDANGDGAVDAGDYFARAGPCSSNALCPNLALTAHPVGAGFVLQ
ncbi:MAG TPA: S8 family serine peptidase [Candidatus Rubrimentiphilum sp.]|nr:S8 family serine peptidase [Candidatus Rubrimentiphilum sp.]